MTFLLDTNAISEPGRSRPDPAFVAWFEAAPESDLYLSVITVGELRRGLALLPAGARRSSLEATQQAILRRFEERIIAIDTQIALLWGDLNVGNRRRGRSPSLSDELIAATALAHDLIVVTRNVTDFEPSGCKVVRPWSS